MMLICIRNQRPKVQCFSNPVHRQFFVSNTVFEQGFSVSSNLSDPNTRDHLVEQYKEFLALKQTQANLCAENMGNELRYMGSATVARDIDFMTTIMDGEDALMFVLFKILRRPSPNSLSATILAGPMVPYLVHIWSICTHFGMHPETLN